MEKLILKGIFLFASIKIFFNLHSILTLVKIRMPHQKIFHPIVKYMYVYVLPISLFTLGEGPLPELLDPIEQVILAIFLSNTLCFSGKKIIR